MLKKADRKKNEEENINRLYQDAIPNTRWCCSQKSGSGIMLNEFLIFYLGTTFLKGGKLAGIILNLKGP